MDKVFLRYLDPAFRYVKSQKPALVSCRDDALREGLNCVALAHLVIRDLFGYVLPARLQALELVRDLEHFEPVPDPEHMQAGDLVWLGVVRPRVEQEEFVPRYDGDELVNGGDFRSSTSPSAPAPATTMTTSCSTPAPQMAPMRCGRCGDSARTTGTGLSTQSGGCDGSFRAVKTFRAVFAGTMRVAPLAAVKSSSAHSAVIMTSQSRGSGWMPRS
jgi:hypothetical protein